MLNANTPISRISLVIALFFSVLSLTTAVLDEVFLMVVLFLLELLLVLEEEDVFFLPDLLPAADAILPPPKSVRIIDLIENSITRNNGLVILKKRRARPLCFAGSPLTARKIVPLPFLLFRLIPAYRDSALHSRAQNCRPRQSRIQTKQEVGKRDNLAYSKRTLRRAKGPELPNLQPALLSYSYSRRVHEA